MRTRYILPVVAAWSLFHPLSISLPLKDKNQSREKIDLLEAMTLQFARAVGNDFAVDRYYISYKGKRINVTKFSLFDILKFRVFSTVHRGHYVMTSTDEYMYRILDDSDDGKRKKLKGNLRASFRPGDIKRERSMYVMNMFEANREASLNNYGTWRLFSMLFPKRKNINQLAWDSFGFKLQCPSGGLYSLDKKTGKVMNSVYGDGSSAVISLREIEKGDAFRRFFTTEEIMVNLEFTPEGIKTVVDIR